MLDTISAWAHSPMFEPTVCVGELIARGILVYLFLVILLRVTGKRQIGQLAPFDLVLLLVLSNAVQNAMNGGDNSFTAGVISATTLITCNWVMGRLTTKSKWLETVIEGRPTILVHNGVIDHPAMAREQITSHELMAVLLRRGMWAFGGCSLRGAGKQRAYFGRAATRADLCGGRGDSAAGVVSRCEVWRAEGVSPPRKCPSLNRGDDWGAADSSEG